MILFVTALNTNTAFAREISEIPVLGAVARIFTFRSYVEESDELKVSVEIPSLEMISEETNGLADSVNQEIHTLCEQYADEAVKRAEEYKKAFMETGGTQEEWEAHNIEIRVFYEIKSQTEDFLSFAVSGTENWTSAYSETRYYNIDLKSEKLVTLEDILGEDYITIVNTDIQRQMQSREESGEVFFSPEEGGFTGISDDVKFYINEALKEGYRLNNLISTEIIGPILVKNPVFLNYFVKSLAHNYVKKEYYYEEKAYEVTLEALKKRIK